MLSGVHSTSMVTGTGIGGVPSSAADTSEMAKLASIMSELVHIITECSIDENSLYRTIAEKMPKETVKKTPTKSSSHLRKKLEDSRASSVGTPVVDDGTIDREAFVVSLFDRAGRAELLRQGLSKFLLPPVKGGPETRNDVTIALEMMRGCVAFHGYCVKALEAAQELIVSSSICRDLGKTRKREIAESIVRFRDATHEKMLQLASQKEVMGDLVRAVISRSNTAAPVASTESPTESPSSDNAIPSKEPAADSSTAFIGTSDPADDFEAVVDPEDVLENLLTEWHLVPREAPLPPVEEYEVDSDSDDDEYLNIRLKATTTSEPVTF